MDRRKNEIERASERKRGIEAIYLLLFLEIEENATRLLSFWGYVSDIIHRTDWMDVSKWMHESLVAREMSRSDEMADQRANRVASAEAPQWTKLMWQAHAPRVTDALDRDQIVDVLSYYAQLERVSTLYRDIVALHEPAMRATSNLPQGTPHGSLQEMHQVQQIAETDDAIKFIRDVRLQKYRDLEAVVLALIDGGNPLDAPGDDTQE